MSEIRPARRSWVHAASFERALSVISTVMVLGLWELSARVHLVDTRFFSAPSSILLVLGEMLQTGELVGHIGVSLQRIAIGFIVGAVPGVLIGLVVGLGADRARADPAARGLHVPDSPRSAVVRPSRRGPARESSAGPTCSSFASAQAAPP